MELRKYFEKAGGTTLLKQWGKMGVLPMAMAEFLLLGHSKKALEQLRLIVGLKILRKLERKYGRLLEDFQVADERKEHGAAPRRIWIFWWQGMENAPLLVRRCYESVREHFADWEITVITEKNYRKYVTFPDYIKAKRDSGAITLTHFSDLLRLELLIKYGGLWLDATVLCTGSNIPVSVLKSDLFVFQAQKPGADGHATLMSSWLMYARPSNTILQATRMLLYEYWKRNKQLVEYFLIHYFFTMACSRFPEEAAKIPPFCNSVPHVLQLHLFSEYDADLYEDLKKMTCFHKLSYKFSEEDMAKKGTFYDVIIKGK